MVCASASMGATIAVNRIVFRATHGLLSPFQGFLVGCRLPVTRGLRRRALGCRPFRACGMLRPGTKRKEGRGMRAWGSGEAQSGYGTKPWCPRDRRPRRGTRRVSYLSWPPCISLRRELPLPRSIAALAQSSAALSQCRSALGQSSDALGQSKDALNQCSTAPGRRGAALSQSSSALAQCSTTLSQCSALTREIRIDRGRASPPNSPKVALHPRSIPELRERRWSRPAILRGRGWHLGPSSRPRSGKGLWSQSRHRRPASPGEDKSWRH